MYEETRTCQTKHILPHLSAYQLHPFCMPEMWSWAPKGDPDTKRSWQIDRRTQNQFELQFQEQRQPYIWGYANKRRLNASGADGIKVPEAGQLEIFMSEMKPKLNTSPQRSMELKSPV
jgi:hypothetical protein